MYHNFTLIHVKRQVASLALGMVFVSHAVAQTDASPCGPLANAFGPFDYRTERGNSLYLVESTHFLPYIEATIRGHTSTTAGGDLDYTLRAFPNHHRALISMMRLGEKEQTPKPRESRYSVECWFDRAIRFRPDDSTVRMIFAGYLGKNGRVAEATAQLAEVDILAKDNAFTHHNVGLVYFDMKMFDKALAQAHKAIAQAMNTPSSVTCSNKQANGKSPTPPLQSQAPPHHPPTPQPRQLQPQPQPQPNKPP